MCGECLNAQVRLGGQYGAYGDQDDDDASFIFEAIGGLERLMSVDPDRMPAAAEENPVRGGWG